MFLILMIINCFQRFNVFRKGIVFIDKVLNVTCINLSAKSVIKKSKCMRKNSSLMTGYVVFLLMVSLCDQDASSSSNPRWMTPDK